MRRHVIVLATVLAVTGVAGCSRDKNDRPAPQAQAPQAQPPVPSTSTDGLPGVPAGRIPPSAGAGSAAAGQTGQSDPSDPAGAAKGHAQSLPTGTEIKATGIGPYTIGQQQATLTSAKLVGRVTGGETPCTTGVGVAKWGSPTLTFGKNKLEHVTVTKSTVHTPAGIKVGSSLTKVRSAYPKGSMLSVNGITAWYAPTGDFALLFRISGSKVQTVEAGPSSILQTGNASC